MLLKSQLVQFSQYNLWANTRISEFILNAGDETVDAEQKSSFTTVRKTWYHIYDAESIWINRIKKETADWPASKNFNGTTADFAKLFEAKSGEFSSLVEMFSEEGLLKNCDYQNIKGEKFTNQYAEIISHVMNHSTYHRGQIITLLRGAGITDVSSTDYIAWCRM